MYGNPWLYHLSASAAAQQRGQPQHGAAAAAETTPTGTAIDEVPGEVASTAITVGAGCIGLASGVAQLVEHPTLLAAPPPVQHRSQVQQ